MAAKFRAHLNDASLHRILLNCRTHHNAHRRCRLRVRATVPSSAAFDRRRHRRALTRPDPLTVRSKRSARRAVDADRRDCAISAECSVSTTTYVRLRESSLVQYFY